MEKAKKRIGRIFFSHPEYMQLIVNVRGILEYWTNGLFKSTMHRVVFRPEHQEMDRYSIACFNQPLWDTPSHLYLARLFLRTPRCIRKKLTFLEEKFSHRQSICNCVSMQLTQLHRTLRLSKCSKSASDR